MCSRGGGGVQHTGHINESIIITHRLLHFLLFRHIKGTWQCSESSGICEYCNLNSDSPTHHSGEFSFKHSIADSRGVVFRLRISPRIRSQNRNGSKCSVRDLCPTDLCKNLGKSASSPCPFNSLRLFLFWIIFWFLFRPLYLTKFLFRKSGQRCLMMMYLCN